MLQVVVRAYDSEADAKAASGARQAELTRLLDAQLAFVDGDTAVPAGLSLREFLASFGVEQAGHEPVKVPSGLIEVAPGPKIVLA